MVLRIRFCRATVKGLSEKWRRALRRGDQRVVRRSMALVLLANAHPVPVVAERVGMTRTPLARDPGGLV